MVQPTANITKSRYYHGIPWYNELPLTQAYVWWACIVWQICTMEEALLSLHDNCYWCNRVLKHHCSGANILVTLQWCAIAPPIATIVYYGTYHHPWYTITMEQTWYYHGRPILRDGTFNCHHDRNTFILVAGPRWHHQHECIKYQVRVQ